MLLAATSRFGVVGFSQFLSMCKTGGPLNLKVQHA